jgi:hypothetical protein
MKVALVYIHPIIDGKTYQPLARRFAQSYMDHPPGQTDHEIYVVLNGGAFGNPSHYRPLFAPLDVKFREHDNAGKDIGAFQVAASEIDCDLMLCFGAPIHFHKAGWLDRIRNCYEQCGPALYGPWGFDQPAPHIRTTAFWLPPELLVSYPQPVSNDLRYEFEHGRQSITSHISKLGLGTYQVTWGGCYPQGDWRHATRAETLIFDQHTDRMGYK